MKKSRFTETQIVKALKENEAGRKVEDVSRELGISTGTFYQWRKKYGGMEASHLKQLKELQAENAQLKRMYAEQALQLEMAKDVISKKW
jgi:putative transposase